MDKIYRLVSNIIKEGSEIKSTEVRGPRTHSLNRGDKQEDAIWALGSFWWSLS
jgi:hypothetical protein